MPDSGRFSKGHLMHNMHKYGILLVLLFAVHILTTSCGQEWEYEEVLDPVYEIGAYTVHTINLVIPNWMHNHPYINHTAAFNTAARRLDAEIRPSGERFQLNIIPIPSFGIDAIHYVQRKELRMMAGQPYDIFFIDKHLHNVWRYAQNGFLADVYALIDESPNVSRYDFYTNVLDAFKMGGNLYTFPLNFTVDLIGINTNAPQSLVDEFSLKTTVTLHELMSIYLNGAVHHWSIFDGFFLQQRDVFPRLVSDFVNLSELTSSMNQNSFIDALSVFQRVQLRNGFMEYTMFRGTDGLTFPRVEDASDSFMFVSHSFRTYPLLAFFEPHRPSFVNIIPVSNEIGQLYIQTLYNFALANTNQSSLVWEFLNLLVNPLLTQFRDVNRTMAWNPLLLPIKKTYAEEHISSTLGRIETRFLSREGPHDDVIIIPDSEARAEIYKTITETILKWAEMPMAPVPLVTFDFLQDDIEQLLHGILTPEEAAQRMHNRVVLWLIE